MPDTHSARPRFCSQCAAAIVVSDARFCKECGAPLPDTIWLSPRMAWRPRTALLLSVVPGLGHWYRGTRLRGLAWFCAVMFFYMSSASLGFLMHVICAANAGFGGTLNEERWVTRSSRRYSARLSAEGRGLR